MHWIWFPQVHKHTCVCLFLFKFGVNVLLNKWLLTLALPEQWLFQIFTSSLLDHPQCPVDCLPWRGRTFLSWASMMMGWKSGEARMWRYHSVWVTQLCNDYGCGYENCFACSGLVAVLCNKLMQLFQFGSVCRTSSILWNHHVRNIQVKFGFELTLSLPKYCECCSCFFPLIVWRKGPGNQKHSFWVLCYILACIKSAISSVTSYNIL